MIPPQLASEVSTLASSGTQVELTESEGWAILVLPRYELPIGYNMETVELLVKVPLSYPNGNPDMFWTDESLLTIDGQVPQNADSIEDVAGKKRRRFSWHPQAWNPGVDCIRTYLGFVYTGLMKARTA